MIPQRLDQSDGVSVAATAEGTGQRLVFGHPPGLAYLAFTEAFERLSFYGMQALLVLYMVSYLLLPGAIEQVAGLEQLRAGLESVTGPLGTQAFASQIFGLYTGFIYLTPLLGGWLGDAVIGRSNAVTIGAVVMAAGHALMAVESSFLIALALLVIGGGLLKGNISAQVGELYTAGDERRTGAFTIFNAFLNFGALAGPLVCGTLGELFGWHYGFGAAGVLMIVGLAVYQWGRRYLPDNAARKLRPLRAAPLSSAEWRAVAGLILIIILGGLQATAYTQQYNVFPLWVQEHTDRNLFGFEVPVSWFLSIDPLATILLTPVFVLLWRRPEPLWRQDEVGKIAIGSAICAAAFAFLALLDRWPGGANVPTVTIFLTLSAISTFYVWPATLSIVSNASPPRIVSFMMGVAFLQVSASSFLVGWIGQWYEAMGPGAFWMLQAAISAAGLFATLVLARPLARILGAGGA